MRFAGHVALVTGSSRGIGRAIALRLAREGADMVVHYRRQTVAAQETAAAVAALGRRVLVIQAELGETSAVRRLFTQVRETFGALDIFVANAAATAFKPLLEQQAHHIDKTFAITVDAFVLAVQDHAGTPRENRYRLRHRCSTLHPLTRCSGCRQGRPRSSHCLPGLRTCASGYQCQRRQSGICQH
jgi:NAD(P)-dependent dehydrogenase (short-subunit alcohol dehydrogenase family)